MTFHKNSKCVAQHGFAVALHTVHSQKFEMNKINNNVLDDYIKLFAFWLQDDFHLLPVSPRIVVDIFFAVFISFLSEASNNHSKLSNKWSMGKLFSLTLMEKTGGLF